MPTGNTGSAVQQYMREACGQDLGLIEGAVEVGQPFAVPWPSSDSRTSVKRASLASV